jgi:hypothetical protein
MFVSLEAVMHLGILGPLLLENFVYSKLKCKKKSDYPVVALSHIRNSSHKKESLIILSY